MSPEQIAKIKLFIKGLFPHRYILKREAKYKTFIPTLQKMRKEGMPLIPEESSKFDSIISIQGFGYSGSGAVLDLLREYPIQVLGFIDKYQGSKSDAKTSISEIEILRLAGGFFEMEKFLDSDNVFLNTAMLNRMVKLFETSALYSYSNEIKRYMVSFFNSLLDFGLFDLSLNYYNPYLTRYDEKSTIFYLKKQSVEEFQGKCRNLLNVIFNRIETDHKILAVDQLGSDCEFKIERNKKYIPNLKTIMVTRDPRDLYVWAKHIDCEWIAHDSVENFIRWYEIYYHNVNYDNNGKDYLIVRYEELIWDYDHTIASIEKYLGLSAEEHLSKFSCFDPKLSSKYTKLYKKHPECAEDIKLIENKLKTYCCSIID